MFFILLEGLSEGGVIGIAIGCLAAGMLIAGTAVFFSLQRKWKKAHDDAKAVTSEAQRKAEEVAREAKEAKEETLKAARQEADLLAGKASAEADRIKAQARTEMAEEKMRLHAEAEAEAKAMRKDLEEASLKLDAREEALKKRDDGLTAKEEKLQRDYEDLERGRGALASQKEEVERRLQEVEKAKALEEDELSRIAGLSKDDAKKEVLAKVAERSEREIAEFLRARREEAEDKAEQNAKGILCLAMDRYAQDVAIERTTTTVSLPNEEMKGRIIGREGRNIKSLESLLGCDLLIDDTPGVLTVSSFDPIRREIALETLNHLIKDGRIQPGRIEEVYGKIKGEIENTIRRIGEDTCMALGLPMISRLLYPYVGRLKYRTSFGQSVLEHCKQVAYLCGMMAAELGLDQTMAKRAGLLHDIGKSADFEMEGSHVDIGVRLAKKFGEPDVVVNAIASHHGDCEKKYPISELVVAADTLSAARPGARRETLENYIKRVEDLEKICKSFEGVSNCYALQSGRDLRVMVLPDKLDDIACVSLAQKIKDRIEEEMTYPGYIKVTVIRETRAIETAR